MYQLRPWWEKHDRFWVTFDKTDVRHRLEEEDVVWAFHPTTRHAWNLLRNLWLAFRVLPRRRPELVVSTGAGVAVPFFLVARVLRIKTAYVEIYGTPTLTGRLCYRMSNLFMVQLEDHLDVYPKAEFIGELL